MKFVCLNCETYMSLEKVEKLARAKDPRIAQVMAGLAGEYDVGMVARADGTLAADVRPLVRLNVAIVAEHEGRREVGSFGIGGRRLYDDLFQEGSWNRAIDEALGQALTNLESVDAPAGERALALARLVQQRRHALLLRLRDLGDGAVEARRVGALPLHAGALRGEVGDRLDS